MDALLIFSYSALIGMPLFGILAALYCLVHLPRKRKFEQAMREYDRLADKAEKIYWDNWPNGLHTEEYQEASKAANEQWHKVLELNPRGF